jgi:hypothetical protein
MSKKKQTELLINASKSNNSEFISNKQIEEMEMTPLDVLANDIYQHCPDLTDNYCGDMHCCACLANALYNAGWRRQSEPSSCGHENGGEWVQLPCKVGDVLYVITQMKDKRILPFINEYEVTSISINKKSIVVYHEMDGYIKSFKQTDFGRTIFLTKEEAERVVTDINVGGK